MIWNNFKINVCVSTMEKIDLMSLYENNKKKALNIGVDEETWWQVVTKFTDPQNSTSTDWATASYAALDSIVLEKKIFDEIMVD